MTYTEEQIVKISLKEEKGHNDSSCSQNRLLQRRVVCVAFSQWAGKELKLEQGKSRGDLSETV